MIRLIRFQEITRITISDWFILGCLWCSNNGVTWTTRSVSSSPIFSFSLICFSCKVDCTSMKEMKIVNLLGKLGPHWQMQHFDLSLVFNEINKFKSVLLSFNFCPPCGPLSYLWDLGQQLWPSQCRIGSSLRVMYGPSAAIETTVWCTMIYRMFMCTHYNYG